MFVTQNTPLASETGRPATLGWEAVDRVAGTVVADAAMPPPAGRPWRAAAGRALGLARAFVLLEDPAIAEAARAPELAETPAHPHRQPLRPPLRSRRPGAAAPPAHLCLTPIPRAQPAAPHAAPAPPEPCARHAP